MTRGDADRDAAKRAKQDFQIACQLLQIKKHHASFQGHGPPHKRAYSCELRAQIPSSWIELGFLSGTLDEIAAAANRSAPGSAATTDGVGKEKGERVLEVYGGAIDFNKNDAQRLAILDLFDAIRVVTGGAIDPLAPPNVGKLAKERVRAARKTLADEGRLMLELVNSSRPHVEFKSAKGGWGAVVSAFVDGGKRVEAEGFGDAKGDAEDAAYGAVSDALRDVVGPERHATLRAVREASPGGSVATLRIPPLPDDAMDALIGAMGTPEDHDARMRAWKAAEARAMSRMLDGDDDAAAEAVVADGGYRRRKNQNQDAARRRAVAEAEDPETRAAIEATFAAEEAARAAAADADPSGPEAAMRDVREKLPISRIREELCDALRDSPVVVVSGGTGSGKSTQCPQYILEDAVRRGKGAETRIVVTQPRRIAAVSVAERVAAERGETCGNSVGFSVRLHGTAPRDQGASVEFVTTGVLLRRLMRDPSLAGVSHVMIDEVHERDINTDFLLVLLRALLRRRPELRVVLMSATLDAESFSDYFAKTGGFDPLAGSGGGDEDAADRVAPPAPLLSVPTKPRHPVEMFYLEDLAGETDDDEDEEEEDEDAREKGEDGLAADDSSDSSSGCLFSAEGMGAKLATALLEAQDEMLERELEEALAEERASDALEACEADEDGECDLLGQDAADDAEDAEDAEWEALEVEVEGGGAPRRVKGRNGRLAHRVRTLRRAVEMRRENAERPAGPAGGRAVVSRAARQAVRRARGGKGRGGGGGGAGDKREREELVVALAGEVARDVAAREVAAGRSGSVLVFLPGWDEIKEIMKTLESLPAEERESLLIIPLHSQVPQEEQQTVFRPAPRGKIKVILATNIAESSVTIDDVLAVVDSGLVREMSYNPESAMSMMGTASTSRASATQRAGRAGRVAPGVCYRLYSRAMFEAMPERPTPEIQRTALEATCLQTCSMTDAGVQKFLSEAMDPPAEETVTLAMDRLKTLGAIAEVRADEDENADENGFSASNDVSSSSSAPAREVLTPLGRLLSQLPLDPATGRMLIMGAVAQCLDPVLTAAACMSSRDPFIVPTGMRDEAQRARRSFCETSDHLAVLRAYAEWRAVIAEDGFDAACRWARDHFLSIQGLQTLTSLRSQLLGELTRTGLVHSGDLGYGGRSSRELAADATVNRHASNEPLVTAVLLTGLPGNLASRRQQAHFGVMRTRLEDAAGLHPGCVAFQRAPPRRRSEQAALPQWFLYKEMVLSSQVFLRDCSAVVPEQVMLFGGSKLAPAPAPPPIEERLAPPRDTLDDEGSSSGGDASTAANTRDAPLPTLDEDGTSASLGAANPNPNANANGDTSPMSIIDDWIVVQSSCADTSELLVDVRRELDAALAHKVMSPRRPVPRASADIIDAVAATMHIVENRNAASVRRLRRSEGHAGGYDRYANRDGFGDDGGPGSAGARTRTRGDARGRGRHEGRLRRNEDGRFVRGEVE